MNPQRQILKSTGLEFLLIFALTTIGGAIGGYSLFASRGTEVAAEAFQFAFTISAIVGAVHGLFFMQRIWRLSSANSGLFEAATTDGLTHLLNRVAFRQLATQAIRSAWRRGDDGAGHTLLIVDADHFKRINDKLGHATGDKALVAIATVLKTSLRADDIVGRIGGEEFAVFLRGATGKEAEKVAERLRAAVNRLSVGSARAPVPLSISIGGVSFHQPLPFDILYRSADKALYKAKANGRNRVELEAVTPEAGRPARGPGNTRWATPVRTDHTERRAPALRVVQG
ncbi:GGDEF domain-containing protein [Mangrovicella endophytica]|uniref:GGDEF domain-containing protein n=1 Tax=Mangrovicella endophytica TaxID=2066697 RepID=UPI000C9E3AD2|nr:GGDEF domain-containing protein [Mangrovicella endophytica]